MTPMDSVSKPARHQGTVVQRLFTDPMAKKTHSVIRSDVTNGALKLNTNGRSGTSPHTAKAANVLHAAIHGERTCDGSPYSSLSMKRIHRSRSAVTTPTAFRSSLPLNPLAARI